MLIVQAVLAVLNSVTTSVIIFDDAGCAEDRRGKYNENIMVHFIRIEDFIIFSEEVSGVS
jgi:hypothetical protein